MDSSSRRLMVPRAVPLVLGATLGSLSLAVLGPCAVATAASPPSSGGSFAISPVSPANVATRRSDFRYQVKAGQEIVDSVQLFNFFGQPQTFELYATNAYNTHSGAFALKPRGLLRAGIGAWTQLSSAQVTVPAQTAETVPFTMSVPADAQPGDYAGGLVALDVTGTQGASAASKVSLREGVATAVFLRVEGRLSPAATIGFLHAKVSVPSLAPLLGTSDAHIGVLVTNTGNTILRGSLGVQVRDALGHVVKRFDPVKLRELLPGSTVTVSEPAWRQLPAIGPEHVQATLDATGLHVVRAAASFWVLPWGIVAGVGALAALLLVVLVLLVRLFVTKVARRRRGRHVAKDRKPRSSQPEQLTFFESRPRPARKLETSSRR